jgi:hypothetical protein
LRLRLRLRVRVRFRLRRRAHVRDDAIDDLVLRQRRRVNHDRVARDR